MPSKVKKPIKKKVVKKKVVKQKQKQAQIQNVKQNQKVIINVPETKTKRKYTKRKAPTPTVQPLQLPQQPQQFQPNAQVQLNDLKQQLREREKVLQKQIDDKLKNEQKKDEKIIEKKVEQITGINPLIQEIKSSRLNKDADNFFSNVMQPMPPPPRISSLSSRAPIEVQAVPETDFIIKEQKKRLDIENEMKKLKQKESDIIQKRNETRKTNQIKQETTIKNDILQLKNKKMNELNTLYPQATGTKKNVKIARIIESKYNIKYGDAKKLVN